MGLIDSPYSFTHTCRIDTDRGFMLRTPMSAGPTMRLVTVEESLSLFLSLPLSLPFLLPIEKKRFSRIPREDSEPLSWRGVETRGGSRAHAYELAIRRYNIIYTREKRKKREKEGKKAEDSVEKLNNQAVCSRERDASLP